MEHCMNEFIRTHGVRLYAVLAAAVPLVAGLWPNISWEPFLAVAAVLLGVGEATQRTENRKTAEALELPSSWESASMRQAVLTDLERRQP
jgi:UV DNA damage repair endonuclease